MDDTFSVIWNLVLVLLSEKDFNAENRGFNVRKQSSDLQWK